MQCQRSADDFGEVGYRNELRLQPIGDAGGGLVLSRTASGSERPVTRPSFADRYCTRPAMTFARTITHTRRKPYWDPALILAATLPGST